MAALQQARTMAGASAEQIAAIGQRIEFMASGADSSDEPSTGYAPVYYPGTTNPASAVTAGKSGRLSQLIVIEPPPPAFRRRTASR